MISDLSNNFGWVTVIQGDPQIYGRLYVGSNGRGILYGDIHTGLSALPAGWSDQDIGTPGSAGSATQSAGAWEVIGGGSGISGTADNFHFAYTTLTGDGTISARVMAVPSASPANNNAKAGVMIRSTLTNSSANAFVALTPGSVNGALFQTRLTTSAGTSSANVTTGIYPPYWVRLTRAGNVFTAYYSADGVTWTQLGSPTTIAMGTSVYVGLASTPSDNNQLNIASFQNVSIVNTINGSGNADAIRLVRDGALTDYYLGGVLQYSFDPTTISQLVISPSASDDAITLDYTGGNPLPANTSIDGGSGQDTLSLIGSASTDTVVFNAASITLGTSFSITAIETRTFDATGGADSVTVNGGSVLFQNTKRLATLALSGGSASIAQGGSSTLTVGSLSLTGGSLNLNDNVLIVDYPGPASPIDDIRTQLVAGHGAAAGIYSSQANASGNLMTLGYAEASDVLGISGTQTAAFAGQTVDATSVLVKFTFAGDADLNGRIDADDYFRIDSNYNKTGNPAYARGDFNFDGRVDGDDYFLIDSNDLANAPPAAAPLALPKPADAIEEPDPVLFPEKKSWAEEFLDSL